MEFNVLCYSGIIIAAVVISGKPEAQVTLRSSPYLKPVAGSSKPVPT